MRKQFKRLSGRAGLGGARRGEARRGKGAMRKQFKRLSGMARHGRAWPGVARQGRYAQTIQTIQTSMAKKGIEMNEEQKHFRWDSGMPTGPDVALLLNKFNDLKVGDQISYEEVAETLGFGRENLRFNTVTKVWRKRLLDTGIVIECQHNVGYFVANCAQITGKTASVFVGIKRAAMRQRKRLFAARPETQTEKTTVEHQGRLLAMLESEAKKSVVTILPAAQKPAPQLAAAAPVDH